MFEFLQKLGSSHANNKVFISRKQSGTIPTIRKMYPHHHIMKTRLTHSVFVHFEEIFSSHIYRHGMLQQYSISRAIPVLSLGNEKLNDMPENSALSRLALMTVLLEL